MPEGSAIPPVEMLVAVTMHPTGLPPAEAAKAWFLRTQEKQPWSTVRKMTRNAGGKAPSIKACRGAVGRMRACNGKGVPGTAYANCGRKPLLSAAEERAVVAFVKKWRAKRFCVTSHIRAELKLKCSVAASVSRPF